MKTLLTIVQEPKLSKDFLRYVAGLAINLGAQVKVHHVHTPANYSMGMVDTTGYGSMHIQRGLENVVENSEKILNEYKALINKEMASQVIVEVASQIGLQALIAEDMVNDHGVDMVVLEGKKDVGFWSQSSNIMDVIKKVKCPVWIIPKGAGFKPFAEIVYATDYKKEDIVSLKKLIATFPHYSPNITALHVTDNADFEERVKKAGFVEMLQRETNYKPLWVKAFYQNEHTDLTEFINEFALKNKADLLVLLKENKSFFERIFNSSHTKEILKKTQLPVLVYHEKY
jgi:nucleotide-binding universal stress UspA family protein